MALRFFERFKRSPEAEQKEVACRKREIERSERESTHWVVVSFKGTNAYVEIIGVSPTMAQEREDFRLTIVDGSVCLSFEGRDDQRVEIMLTLDQEMVFSCHSQSDPSKPAMYTFYACLKKVAAKAHAARFIPNPPPSRTGAGS